MTNNNYAKEYEARVAEYVLEVMDKYAKRKDIFEPLTKILGEYWNDTIARSVKEVLFEKKTVYVLTEECKNPYKTRGYPEYEAKTTWTLRTWKCPQEMNYAFYIAKKVIEFQRDLKKMIWRKNDWGNPYTPEYTNLAFQYKDVDENGKVCLVTYEAFKEKYLPEVESKELLNAIYAAIIDAFWSGKDIGEKCSCEKRTDFDQIFDHITMIEAHDSIELALSNLKKLIDKR
jgi:hypothetical protein